MTAIAKAEKRLALRFLGGCCHGSLRIAARGVEAFQAYATAELGVIAYESAARAGLIVNEGLIVEIVRPGTLRRASARVLLPCASITVRLMTMTVCGMSRSSVVPLPPMLEAPGLKSFVALLVCTLTSGKEALVCANAPMEPMSNAAPSGRNAAVG